MGFKMNSLRKRSMSSSSDEVLQSLLDKKNKTDDLFSCQIITCEFCDEAFLNRYNYLVHNANHIIIPLLRQTFFRCPECQQQCRTDRKLGKHIKKKHPHLRTHRKKKHSTGSEDIEESQVNNNNEHENINEEFVISVLEQSKEKELDLPKTNYTILPESLLANGNANIGVEIIEIESDDDDVIDIKYINNDVREREKIQNRLVFEDEEEDDIIKPNGLINDLMSDIKVSVNLEPWMSSITHVGNEAVPGQEKQSEEWRSMTVSYQELITMQDIACRYCDKTFPNRLSLIKHEPTHISNKKFLRRPYLCQICDWYCDPPTLKNHHKSAHPGKELKLNIQSMQKTCHLCKLKYVCVQKHMQNYHNAAPKDDNSVKPDLEIVKEIYKGSDITKDIFTLKGRPHFNKRIIKVCDFCASFLRNITDMVYYRSIGEKSVFGERQTCDRCLKQFFSINLVEMSTRFKEKKKDKPLSNIDRLKNIQNRLKLINKIRKFFSVFYYSQQSRRKKNFSRRP